MITKTGNLKLEYMFLCDHAFLTDNGKPGIIGIFDILGVNKTPAMHPDMYLFANFEGEPNSEHTLEIKADNPAGKSIVPANNPPKIKLKLGTSDHGNFIHRFLNFPLELTGEYKFSLVENG